jgi:ribosomal protein S18 acetylase RimI-like enzyme
MTKLTIIDVEPHSVEIRAVRRLHRAAKATLGFLPDQGFTDRAERGTLLAAVDDGRVVGYTLFDLTGDRVKLRHLCASKAARNGGVARALVDEIKRRHGSRRSIVLDCRRDYQLASMWQSLGFRAVHERRGRSQAGHPLTIWELDFGHPTLFSAAPAIGDLACLDQMVLEDLAVERPEGRHSRHLLEDWVDELVEFCVTDEILGESNDTNEGDLRRVLMAAAASYRNLSRHDAPWGDHVGPVAELIPRAGAADHRHLARAIEGGAMYFVTRDEKILSGSATIRDAFGILVVSPDGLLDRLDRQRSQDRYEPAVLQGTDLTEERLAAAESEAFVAALLNNGEGERAHALRATLRTALADPQNSEVLVVRDADGEILAGVARTWRSDHLEVLAVRVRRVNRLTDAVARQLVFQQRKAVADRALQRVIVTDRKPSPAVRRALPVEFFDPHQRTWTCSVGRGLLAASEVVGGPPDLEAAAVYERRHWPAKIVGAGLVTYMVSIEPSFAERLFDAHLAEATLFSRDPALGLSREHVYYRSPGTTKNLAGPARVLWYVKQKPGHPVGHVRAVSHLVDVVRDRPRTLYNRYSRLGVWTQQQVEDAGKRTGEAMALRVTDTELLKHPLSIDALRTVYESVGKRFAAPQGPIRVDEHTFCLLYRRSSAYA